MMDSSAFLSLPNDCFIGILGFLRVEDFIRISSTSALAMSSVSAELLRHRKRMTQSYCYCSLQENPKPQPLSSSVGGEIHLLPTIRDRVESLWRALSVSHPSCALVVDLVKSMREKLDNNDHVAPGSDFVAVFRQHKRIAKAHKLHTIALRRAIYAEPNHYDKGYNGYSSSAYLQQRNILTVTLERYIGDVLIAFFLMGHTASGIVDAGPTDEEWEASIQQGLDLTLNDTDRTSLQIKGAPIASWYRTWIYLHSTLLRNAPLTWNHHLVLGIASPSATQAASSSSVDVARGSLLRPHRPFMGQTKLPMLQLLETISNFQQLRVVTNSFGPLGPSFRGRDEVQSQGVYPTTLIGLAKRFDKLPSAEYLVGPVSTMPTFLREWASGSDPVLQCLLDLHKESRKSRPMTVTPPLVTIKAD